MENVALGVKFTEYATRGITQWWMDGEMGRQVSMVKEGCHPSLMRRKGRWRMGIDG